MPTEKAELLASLRLVHAEGVGPVTFRRLVRVFGSPQAVLGAPHARLREVPDVGPKVAEAIAKAAGDDWAERELSRARELGVSLLGLDDPGYPQPLLKTHDPPPVLYVKGELNPSDVLAVAIVGSRRSTPYGRAHVEKLAAGLALAGFTVVSGLAKGIDTIAHVGALSRDGGRTLAVLGNGLETVYPPENKELLARIVDGRGAVLSEVPFEAPPSPQHFPRRNRIIAGLSLGVVVADCTETSGALITAGYAVDMDREVFAIPGPVDSPNARGPHRLIKKGAKLVEDVEDVLEEIRAIAEPLVKLRPHDLRFRVATKQDAKPDAAPLLEAVGEPADPRPAGTDLRAINLNPREAQVYGLLDATMPREIDYLIVKSGLKPQEVLATLLVLEVRRLCRQLPGKRFVKA